MRKQEQVSPATLTLRRKQDFINEYKMEQGCANPNCCWDGDYTPMMLHLDHIDHKNKDPRLKKRGHSGLRNFSWADIVTEIAKCQVLCANCHSLKTQAEREEI